MPEGKKEEHVHGPKKEVVGHLRKVWSLLSLMFGAEVTKRGRPAVEGLEEGLHFLLSVWDSAYWEMLST